MIVTLIGYRGTGKTSVAPRLAQRWGWEWVDADVELERRAGRTIREIFATGGEVEFRQLERANLQELLQRDQLVLAAGGGAILNEETRRDFRTAGPVVWLHADVDTIVQRIAHDATTASRRPDLTSAGGVEEIRALLAAREPLYRETATVIVDTMNKPVDAVVDEIVSLVVWAVPTNPD